MAKKIAVGHHVIVNDRNNFYFGQEAVVTAIHLNGSSAGRTVYSVEVGNVSFGLCENLAKEIKYED